MDKLTIEERNAWFIDTLEQCSTKLLNNDDDLVIGILYDDLESEARAVFYVDSLKILLDDNLIDDEIFKLSLEIREKSLTLLNRHPHYSINEIRSAKEWQDFFLLGDKILALKKKFCKKEPNG